MPLSEGLENAIAELARVTVERGADPGKVIEGLLQMVNWRNDVWPHLTPHERYAFLVKMRHMREEARDAHLGTEPVHRE